MPAMQWRRINTMKAAHIREVNAGLNKKTGAILIILFMILLGVGAGYLLVGRSQSPQEQAAEVQSGPSCPLDGFICRWNRQPGVAYHYLIKDNASAVIKEGDIPAGSGTDKITVTHTPESGKTYTCQVEAKNECGTANAEKAATCSAVPQPTALPETPTPTPPGITASPIPTLSVTSTP